MDREAALDATRPIAESLVWAIMATVGPDGAPRTRVVHPVWQWELGVGWITSRGSRLLRRHLEHQPIVSLAYWSIDAEAYLECRASWVPQAEVADVWEVCRATPEPIGFDPAPMFPDGPGAAGSAALRLEPLRIRVGSATGRVEPGFWSVSPPRRAGGGAARRASR